MNLNNIKFTDKKYVNTIISVLLIVAFIPWIYFSSLHRCFPEPANYFQNFPTTPACRLLKSPLTLKLLQKSKQYDWKIYAEKLVQRRSLIDQLSQRVSSDRLYEMDYLYANKILDHPLYYSYIQSLLENRIIFSPLPEKSSLSSLTYDISISENKLSVNMQFDGLGSEDRVIKISYPSGFLPTHIGNLATREQLSPEKYLIESDQVAILNSDLSPISLLLTLQKLSDKNQTKQPIRLAFIAKPHQDIPGHRLQINYPPSFFLETLNPPDVAQPGMIAYNLNSLGLSIIDLTIYQND